MMKSNSRLALGLAVLALAVAGAWLTTSSAARAAGQEQRPTRVAVVSVPRIVNELRESRDLDEKFAAERAQLAGEEAKMKEQIKNLESQAGNFRPDSPQYEDLQNQYIDAVAKYKVWGETRDVKIKTQKKRLTRMLYDKVQAAVSEYAQREGYDVVISDVQPNLSEKEFAQVPLEQIGAVLNQRRVLYASKNCDITQAIIALLDSKYRSDGAVGGAGGGAGAAGAGAGAVGAGAGANPVAAPAAAAQPGQQQGQVQTQAEARQASDGRQGQRRPTNR